MGVDLVRVGIIVLVMSGLVAVGGATASGSDPVRVPLPGATPPVAMAEPEDRETEVVVRPGDHLWKISARHLQGETGRPPRPGETAPYWREVIAVNRDRLRSGDPDLIFPGEVVRLP